MNNRDAATAMHHRHHRRNDNNNLSQRQASGDGTGNGDSACGSSSSSSSSCRPRYPTSAGAAGPLLFNEQFILKPPRSAYSSAFAWHRDSDWCRDSSTYDYSPYVSVRSQQRVTYVLISRSTQPCYLDMLPSSSPRPWAPECCAYSLLSRSRVVSGRHGC